MSKRIMIFETSVGDGGHHLEYLHHLYLKAVKKIDKSFVFVVPEQFKITSKRFEWPEAHNISFEFIDDFTVKNLRKHHGIRYAFFLSLLAARFAKRNKIDEIFLISFLNYFPFLALLLPRHVKISGILYYIYLYDWKQMGLIRRIEQVVAFKMFSSNSKYNKLYILNDSSATAYLNRLYKTDKFYYIPDPVPIDVVNLPAPQNVISFAGGEKIFLQCGMITERKRTIDIFRAIGEIESWNDCYFVFAGKVTDEIKKEFYDSIGTIKDKAKIMVKDMHLSYEEMTYYLKNADYIFILYDNNSQSSGFLGHAAAHQKPVISFDFGLVGKLVKKYHLGFTVNNNRPGYLSSKFLEIKNTIYTVPTLYSDTHQVEDFNRNLFED